MSSSFFRRGAGGRTALLVAAVALGVGGCISPEMGRIKRDIEAQVEQDGTAEVGRGFAVTVGRGSIGTTRFLSRLVAPQSTEPYRLLSRHVRQVKVARYPLSGAVAYESLSRPALLDGFEDDGWQRLVTVRDTSSAAWIMTREEPDSMILTDLLAVVVGDGELVVTRLRGDLTTLVLDAVALGSGSGLLDDALGETGLFGTPDEEPPEESVQ